MAFGILIIGCAGKIENGTFTPGWLARFDPDAYDGGGSIEVSQDPAQATRFETMYQAFDAWRRQSTVRPLREDGEPNRPMTVFSIEVLELPDA